jgi:hypothetical protein
MRSSAVAASACHRGEQALEVVLLDVVGRVQIGGDARPQLDRQPRPAAAVVLHRERRRHLGADDEAAVFGARAARERGDERDPDQSGVTTRLSNHVSVSQLLNAK